MATFISKITVDARGVGAEIGEKLRNGIKKATNDIQNNDAKKKAAMLRNTIANKYDKYLANNPYLRDVDDDTRIDVILYERKAGEYGVKVQGKNVIYYEYGTGTRGKLNPHPAKPGRLKDYGKGRYILQYGRYVNNKSKNAPPSPRWYPFNEDGSPKPMSMSLFMATTDKDLGSVKNIAFSDLVWKHNGVITLGAPAGKFIYESVELFKSNFGEEAGMITYKKSISVRIKNSIESELKTVR